jgi:hypothetical protein
MTYAHQPFSGDRERGGVAALILFGATIGISFALIFSWLEMKDSLANFLGGVLGAGLGAALAVLGAVYVQRRDHRARLSAPINQTVSEVENLATQLNILKFLLDPPSQAMFSNEDDPAEATDKHIRDIKLIVANFPSAWNWRRQFIRKFGRSSLVWISLWTLPKATWAPIPMAFPRISCSSS